ncbi:Re/Si-specific NAD(P)(+) transhydrogenase subunit alpha [Chelativorans sp. AA-79]|uniref:Re/Si-specific NAD(P)(+) transhydrogenase subunit alpha n=1 Tax=Chelativorans sp. AA-79 TaxID=3028735 RepID=UPI0023F69383|nr:Re/Si-specific NAD(P)(+) transhydrogenase subunit alpha [Chelativorans sp. AA-79]WEX10214.1 Re/Si-specific NAD(P)(+) transhydrogenase subunit alpha [Chelativorans sp. AA-79]
MGQTIFVPREADANEPRVAASPDTVKRLKGLGFDVAVERGAGLASRIPDDEFEKAGATLGGAADASRADIVLKLRRPTAAELETYRKGAVVIATMDPHGNEADIAAMAKAGVTAFAMEFMPRITRAQSMDVLSSQANLAGYRAVIDAAAEYDRALPMMMTAAGTVPAAKVFVMGAGVAGLQAIATARRLGAVVTATDVRAAAGEQVASLGAKFIMTDALKDASGQGGYARELTEDEKKAQAELVADHITKQDIVITTALIPGRPAPRLVTAAMVASMRPGSVIVDLAVERGGNVEGSVAGQVVTTANDVKILGHLNVPGRVAASASLLYARNLFAFLETMVDKEAKALSIDFDDELVKATMLTHDGAVVHPNFAGAAPAAGARPSPSDPEVVKAAAGTEPGLEVAPKRKAPARRKAAAKPAAGKAADGAKPARRTRKPATPRTGGDA